MIRNEILDINKLSEISSSTSIQNKSLIVKTEQIKGKVHLSKKLMKTKNSLSKRKHDKKEFLTNEDIDNLVLVGRKYCIFICIFNLIISLAYLVCEILLQIHYKVTLKYQVVLLSSIGSVVVILIYQLIIIIVMAQKQFKLSIYLQGICYIYVIVATFLELFLNHTHKTLYLILPIIFAATLTVLGVIQIILILSSSQYYQFEQDQAEERKDEEKQNKLIDNYDQQYINMNDDEDA